MVLIPEQVKMLRDAITHLEEQKKDYETYLKECEKSTMDCGFIKHFDNTLEADNYNNLCKKLDSYRRMLVENEFIAANVFDNVACGTEFTVFYDDTKEEETYTLVENLVGVPKMHVSENKSYISMESNLGKAVLGKSKDDDFLVLV